MTESEMAQKILGLICSEHLNVPANEVEIMHHCQEWMKSFTEAHDGEEEQVSP